jgi:cell division septation protein DedD
VPEFNFAKGKSGAPKKEQSAPTPQRSETGPTRPVSADHVGDELPFELAEAPVRRTQPTQPKSAAMPRGATEEQGKSAGGSILDKYPRRDLSHLNSSPELNAADKRAARTEVQTPAGDDPLMQESPNSEESAEMSSSSAPARSSSRWPMLIIGGVVVLLVLIALIWHLNPYPPLKEAIAGLFTNRSTQSAIAPATPSEQQDDFGALEPEMRSWDYFIQVSSWKELMKADQEAEKFRSAGLDVAVESEALSKRGGTFYRVRLGPYESAEAAYAAAAAHPGLLPADAFLDSVRLTEAVPVAAGTPETGRPARMRGGTAAKTDPADDDIARWRKDFGVVDEPLSGYAVQVSSLRSVDVARVEARKMVEQGYPAFITRATVGSATWYRVLVGPFNTRGDADKYTRLINVTYGNEAYTVDLSLK